MKALGVLALLVAGGLGPGAATTATTTSSRPAAAKPAKPAKPGDPTPPTQVDAAEIEYHNKEHRTVMIGKPLVTFTRQDAVLVCRKMTADHFQGGPQSGDIQKAVCEGDVKFTRGDQIVTCKRATYTAENSKIVCRGDPVLHDGKSIMYCDEVIYDIELDKVFLKQGKGTIYQKPGQTLPGKKKEKVP